MAANQNPQNILHRKIVLGTVSEGNVIEEAFRVYGPYGQGITVNRTRVGEKYVIPLTNENGEGSYFMKIHMPITSSSDSLAKRTVYVTFCEKNNAYDDGYKDYIQRVPQDYATAVMRWIDNGRTPSTSGEVRYRKLSFTAYGLQTARIQNAVSFEMRMNYVGAQIAPPPFGNGQTATTGLTSTRGGINTVGGNQNVQNG